MERNEEILIVEQKNGNLYAIEGFDESGRILKTDISSANINDIKKFNIDVIKTILEKLAQSIIKDEPNSELKNIVVYKVPFEELKQECAKSEKVLSRDNIRSNWLLERSVNIKEYIKKTNKLNTNTRHESANIIDVKRIDKAEVLRDWGINLDTLRENGDLEKMLNYGRSSLITCYPIIGGVCFPMQAKFSLTEKHDGRIALIPHPIRKSPNLKEYRGYMLTNEDRTNLLETGNMGHTIEVVNRITGVKGDVYVSLDKETNELVSLSKGCITIPPKIKGVELSDSQKEKLENGGKVTLNGLQSSSGKIFDACIQVSAERRCITFRIPSLKQNQGLYIGGRILGKEITEDIRKEWHSGKWVYFEDMISKSGQKFSSYVRPNYKTQKFDFSKRLPEEDPRYQSVAEKSKRLGYMLDDMTINKASYKIADEKIMEYDKQRKMRL